jgi:hypothetical protein
MNKYSGRRFASLILAFVCLVGGYFGGDPDSFGAFSTAVTVLYAAYLTGQSATDWQKAKNGDGHEAD